MLPMMLGLPGHDQQRAMPQHQGMLDARATLAPQIEATLASQTERGNQRGA